MTPEAPLLFNRPSSTNFSSNTVHRSLVAQQSMSLMLLLPPSPFTIFGDTVSEDDPFLLLALAALTSALVYNLTSSLLSSLPGVL